VDFNSHSRKKSLKRSYCPGLQRWLISTQKRGKESTKEKKTLGSKPTHKKTPKKPHQRSPGIVKTLQRYTEAKRWAGNSACQDIRGEGNAMYRREKKGGKREERGGSKDREKKNERNVHAGGSEGEERSEGERESKRARKRKPRNSSGTAEAALKKAPQKTVLADWLLPYLHCHK
jgi:hypothetical protein